VNDDLDDDLPMTITRGVYRKILEDNATLHAAMTTAATETATTPCCQYERALEGRGVEELKKECVRLHRLLRHRIGQ
jgi:hypothetical protein